MKKEIWIVKREHAPEMVFTDKREFERLFYIYDLHHVETKEDPILLRVYHYFCIVSDS